MEKTDKQKREDKIRKFINTKAKEGMKYIYFAELIGMSKANFSMFVNGKIGVSLERLEKMEKMFGLNKVK